MSVVLFDSATDRRARARAQAAAIVDTPRPRRRYSAPGPQLRRSQRARRSARVQRSRALASPRAHTRRWVAAGVLLAELAALVLVLTLPAFRVHAVTVSGNRLISAESLLRIAAVPQGSIFTVDGDSVRTRLLSQPWVQDASVVTELPGTVRITVVERAPVLRVRHAGGDVLVAANGATAVASAANAFSLSSVPVLVDDRIGSVAPIDLTLLQTLAVTAQRFASVYGCPMAAFQWGSDGVFAIWATTGWRAVLGHLDTDAAVNAVPNQLAALAALKGQLDFAHPNFGYVDLDNPAAPVAGGTPALPAAIAAAQSTVSAVAPPVSTPTPAPTPSPATSPTPSATPAVTLKPL